MPAENFARVTIKTLAEQVVRPAIPKYPCKFGFPPRFIHPQTAARTVPEPPPNRIFTERILMPVYLIYRTCLENIISAWYDIRTNRDNNL